MNAKKEHREPVAKLASGSEFLSGLKEGDRLVPCITLVLYYGADPWTGPRTLHDMLDWENGREMLKAFVPDYPLNLIEPYGIAVEHFAKFKTELYLILKYIKYSNDKQGLSEMLKQDTTFHSATPRVIDTINQITGSSIRYHQGEEAVNVSNVIDEMIQDAVGVAVQEKENQMNNVIDEMIQDAVEVAVQEKENQHIAQIQQMQEQIEKMRQLLTPEQLQKLA